MVCLAAAALAPISFRAVLPLLPIFLLFPACAFPRLADVSPPPPRLNGVCLRLFVGGVPPRPADVLPPQLSFDALPRLGFRLLVVVGVQPQLPVGLRPLGVLPATTTLALMLYRYSRRTFRPEGQQPRSKMHRG